MFTCNIFHMQNLYEFLFIITLWLCLFKSIISCLQTANFFFFSVCPTWLPWEQIRSRLWRTRLISSWWRSTRNIQDSSMWVAYWFIISREDVEAKIGLFPLKGEFKMIQATMNNENCKERKLCLICCIGVLHINHNAKTSTGGFLLWT